MEKLKLTENVNYSILEPGQKLAMLEKLPAIRNAFNQPFALARSPLLISWAVNSGLRAFQIVCSSATTTNYITQEQCPHCWEARDADRAHIDYAMKEKERHQREKNYKIWTEPPLYVNVYSVGRERERQRRAIGSVHKSSRRLQPFRCRG